MNHDELQGKWKQLKGKAQQHWGKITDDEWDRAQGSSEELEGIIQEKYGKSKAEAKQEVNSWLEKL